MRRQSAKTPAPGFSLVELLVVIVIIGLLVSLLLPAVQAAREAARRTVCLNNLRQIGIGLQNYHGVCERFPPGGIEHRWTVNPATGKLYGAKGRQLAWSAMLLPYVEQESLHRQIDFAKAFDSPENAAAAATVLPVYLCPSIPRTTYLRSGRGACDYGGVFGERISGVNDPPKGVMIYTRAFAARDITDGTSNTLMIAEDYFGDMQWINALNVFDVSAAINTANENDIHSYHPRGAHGLLADGSAQFLSDDLNLTVLAALCTRAGGENIGKF